VIKTGSVHVYTAFNVIC